MAERRGRPYEVGLEYFPKMVDFYDDDRIFDLLDAHGPLGVVVYDCILCIVYKNGYYAEIPLEKLSRMIIKMIGGKWIRNKDAVVQVILFCADIGLLNDDLLKRGVITSAGIQKRFYKIAVKLMRRRLYNDDYWLLEDDTQKALLSAPKNGISSEENRIVSEENRIVSEEKPYKSKVNKNIYTPAQPEHRYFKNTELNESFKLYLSCRLNNGDLLSEDQIELLREDLINIADTDTERIAVVKKATMSNWKSFWPIKKNAAKDKPAVKKKTRFSNFPERNNDTENMEKKLLQKRVNNKV